MNLPVIAQGSHLLERVAMSTNTTGLRRLAILIPLISALTLILASCATTSYGNDAFPKTSKYVFEKFNSGEYLELFTPGKPDAGITLEAMTQLSALGYDKNKQQRAISWIEANTKLFKSLGLKAAYVFTAHSLGFSDHPTVRKAATEVTSMVADSVNLSASNNFEHSWLIFALLAEGQKDLANQVAMHLSTLSEPDGGYKYLQGDSKSVAAADITAFALLSMNASLGTGNSTDEAAKEFAMSKAKSWLLANQTQRTYWSSFGNVDVSGTSYAVMALKSLNMDVSKPVEWLKSRINETDGGISAPWTEPKSDSYSTVQALLALSELNFIDVLQHEAK
jgi:hypothetical protein